MGWVTGNWVSYLLLFACAAAAARRSRSGSSTRGGELDGGLAARLLAALVGGLVAGGRANHRALAKLANSSQFNSLLRSRPKNDSAKPFSQGLPGLMCSISKPACWP